MGELKFLSYPFPKNISEPRTAMVLIFNGMIRNHVLLTGTGKKRMF